jgi:ADP-dependent NAD(P)H-hydrate dehydratase / NAD(P)H-hydrate epimerase
VKLQDDSSEILIRYVVTFITNQNKNVFSDHFLNFLFKENHLNNTMLNIFNKIQIATLDQNTITKQSISAWQLMERASKLLTAKILEIYPNPDHSFCIVCGKGNNGGDGLAIARMLRNEFRSVEVITLDIKGNTHEYHVNLQSLRNKSNITVQTWEDFKKKTKANIIIDAVLGYSCDRKPINQYLEAINWINNTGKDVISIDIPSGMPVDFIPNWPSVNATHTLSIGPVKITSLLPETSPFYGTISIIDIDHADSDTQTEYYYLDKESIISLLKKRPKFGHKGTFGHAGLFVGSKGMMGAGVLSTNACLRSGVGLVTVVTPEAGYQIIQSTSPEAMCVSQGVNNLDDSNFDFSKYSSIGIGCGIGIEKVTKTFVTNMLKNIQVPMVIDADALNIIAEDKLTLPKNCIITPHPKEFDRLFGSSQNSLERIEKQKEQSKILGIVIVLKGHHTSISDTFGNIYFNSTGNSGMAKGGFGDVLTGLITGLLAQGYSNIEASIIGVYLHGLAGDIAATEVGQISMVASDLVNRLGEAFKRI